MLTSKNLHTIPVFKEFQMHACNYEFLPKPAFNNYRNFSINPGRGGLFLEVRITHDGCAYVRRTGISSNVTADKGNF